MICFSLLSIDHLPLVISLMCEVFVVCSQDYFEHIVEKFIFFMTLCYGWARFYIRVLVDIVRLYTFDDSLREYDKGLAVFRSSVLEVSECSAWDLYVTGDKVSWNARLEFPKISLAAWEYRIFCLIKELTLRTAELQVNLWHFTRKACAWWLHCWF